MIGGVLAIYSYLIKETIPNKTTLKRGERKGVATTAKMKEMGNSLRPKYYVQDCR